MAPPVRVRKPPTTNQTGNSSAEQTSTAQLNIIHQVSGDEGAGINISVHPTWPDINCVQGELFFECTLFLYSVLALFLQYLNLYKTLWWLPKSYWHYSLKFHLINPYFLSCVGLLLGLRVTKCFWKTITELSTSLSTGRSQFIQSCCTVFEYAIVKTPMMTMVVTSFMFSFSRVCNEYPLNSIQYFFQPLAFYLVVFRSELMVKWRRAREILDQWWNGSVEINDVCDRLCEPPPNSLDLESVVHMCSTQPAQIREEVSVLVDDLYLRLKRCLFAGLSTAFLSIFLPCQFVPYKTHLGLTQKMLVDSGWEFELFVVVALTSFSLYVTYLLPLNYLDLLHRSAVHLGIWEFLDEPSNNIKGGPQLTPLWNSGDALHPEGSIVCMPDGRRYKAVGSPATGTIAAEPGNAEHVRFYRLCSRPSTLINIMCCFEGILILAQFWMLVLTTDWQHIVTLVLLMFANYLLLAKLFKDKVIVGRVYDPSPEDRALVEQLRSEAKNE